MHHISGTHRGKKVPDHVELELQMVITYHVGAGKKIHARQTSAIKHGNISPDPVSRTLNKTK